MDRKFIISPSPHIHSGRSTSGLMSDVIIALVPAFLVSVFFMGFSAVIVTAVAVLSCIIFEWSIQKFLLKERSSIGDYSAALTGLLIAFNLPSTIPLWLVVLGSLVAIGVGKMSFGGIGRNVFNPALVGRVFLLISFPVQMTSFSVDGVSGPTPLSLAKEVLSSGGSVADVMNSFNYVSLFIGDKSGSLGEISAVALLIGLVYMLFRKVITWHIPVYVIGSMALFSGLLNLINPDQYLSPLFEVLTGGALLGAIFMATDYVTSPMNPRGAAIYGVGIGVITILIRTWGAYPEGISFAILIMNAVVPLINNATKPRRFAKR